jgi:hypothetical protein
MLTTNAALVETLFPLETLQEDVSQRNVEMITRTAKITAGLLKAEELRQGLGSSRERCLSVADSLRLQYVTDRAEDR